MRFVELMNDFVFRKIFGRHPHPTAAFLNDALDRQGDACIVEFTEARRAHFATLEVPALDALRLPLKHSRACL